MKRIAPTLLFIAYSAASCVAAGVERSNDTGAERASDFAYAVPIDIDGNGALYQLELPQSVYEGAVHGDLSDLAVFNGGLSLYLLH